MLSFIKKRKEQKGFTLIEVMLVVAMIAMLAGMTVPITFGSLKKQSVEEESSKLLSILRQTQAKSMKGRGDSPWGVYFTPESYTVFKGNSYEERESVYDEVFEISPGMSVAGAPEIVFDYEGIPRIKGLVGHWTMNEGEGGVAHDLSGQENHGTLVNNPTWANGKVGGALDFDGVDDYVEVNNQSLLTANYITTAAWIKSMGKLDSSQVIVIKRTSLNNSQFEFKLDPSYNLNFDRYLPSGGSVSSISAIPLNEWVFVSMILKDTENEVDFYINGVFDSINSYIENYEGDSSSTITIGRSGADSLDGSSDPWRCFNGLIDDVRIYNRALTAEEIRLMYESGLEGVDDNIVELSGSGESVKINIGRQGRIEIVR